MKKPVKPKIFDNVSLIIAGIIDVILVIFSFRFSLQFSFVFVLFISVYLIFGLSFSWLFIFPLRFLKYFVLKKKYDEEIRLINREKAEKEKTERREKAEKEKTERREKAEKEKAKKEKLKKFEEEQIKKGLIKYRGHWITSKQYKLELKVDKFIEKCDDSNKYKGLFVICNNCGYVWKVRKDYDLPSKCSKCGSIDLELDRDKVYDVV